MIKTFEGKSLAVVLISSLTMLAEIYFGFVTNSMALLADGFHMGAHVLALGIAFVVCMLARRFREKADAFNFWGGKLNAVLLFVSAFGIIFESGDRFFNPLDISFSEAILVAFIGLIVNSVCLFVMFDARREHHGNLNYKAAYLHILADALTSVLAISALFVGKTFGYARIDSVVGVMGGLLILQWSVKLLSAKKAAGPCSCGHCH